MKSNDLYPLKFETIFKEKIWGGQKIKNVLKKDFGDLSNCGETWEVSGVEGDVSVVSNGRLKGRNLKQLIEEFGSDFLGEDVYERFGMEFPLLIKFIDANDDLSIQVHPDDNVAKKRHNSFGKTEMWYVMQADSGATLISGFNKSISQSEYLDGCKQGKLVALLNKESAIAGDVFFLPAGRIHTIGKGLLIAEIQQTSDVTYRIDDFGREDAEGNRRELHFEQAIDVLDFECYDDYKTKYQDQIDRRTQLVSCSYFETNKLKLTSEFVVDNNVTKNFKIYIGLSGKAEITGEFDHVEVEAGQVVLIPALINSFKVKPIAKQVELLETYVPEI